MRNYILLPSIFVFLWMNSQAQPIFKRFTSEDGLSNNSIRHIIQDKKGFIWFGTLNGLNRYDGKNIKIYQSELGNLNSLSSNKIYSITEDSLGFLWILTYNDDIHRFDPRTEKFLNVTRTFVKIRKSVRRDQVFSETSAGIMWLMSINEGGLIRFRTTSDREQYHVEFFNITNLLPDNIVNFVHKDKTGKIWIGTNNGLIYMDTDTFNTKLPKYHRYFDGHEGFCFEEICETDEIIWFGTRSSGLLTYSFSDKKLEKWREDLNITAEINGIMEGIANDILVTTTREGIFYILDNGEKVYQYKGGKESSHGADEVDYFGIYVDRFGKFWIESAKRGITLFDPEKPRFTHYGLNAHLREALVDDEKLAFVEDANGDFWMSIYGGGLCRFNRNTQKFDQYFHDPNDPFSLSSNLVLSLFEDQSKNLWIGTYQGGLNKLELLRYNFKYIQPVKGASVQLENEVRSIIVDKLGRIWIGTKEGHVYCYNNEKEICFKIPEDLKEADNYSKASVYSMLEDSKGNLWIGTQGDGLYMIKGLLCSKSLESKFFKAIRIENNFIDRRAGIVSRDKIFVLLEDHLGQIWMGSYNGGLNLIDNINMQVFDVFTHDPINENSISDNRLRYILQDSKRNLWIGTSDGLNLLKTEYLDSSEKKFIRFTSKLSEKSSLSNSNIEYLHQDKAGNIWIATYGGGLNILHQNKKTGEYWFEHFTRKQGLSSDIIFSILEDNEGNFWLGTDNGLCKFSTSGREIEKYIAEEGLGNNFFLRGSCAKSPTGEFAYGHKTGFVCFFPDSIKQDKRIYPLVLTGFSIFGKQITPDSEKSPLKTTIETTSDIILKYDQNFIEIEYATLDYLRPERCQYAYYLEGIEDKWNFVGNKHVATYTNLNPGKYTFRVKGSNHDGRWNEEGTSIRIIITPPFWHTWGFRITGFLIIIASIIIGYKIRIARIHAHNRELEQHVKERTKELKMINQELESFTYSVSHDLRAPLRGMSGFSKILIEEYADKVDEKAQHYIHRINDAGKHMNILIDDILKLSRITRNKLVMERVDLSSIVESIVADLKQKEPNRKVKVYIAKSLAVRGDKALLTIMLENLLGNAWKFTSRKPETVIEFGKTFHNNHQVFFLKDNGIGFDNKFAAKIFEAFHRLQSDFEGTGIGLATVQRIISRHHGKIWAESELGKKTIFYFTFPEQ